MKFTKFAFVPLALCLQFAVSACSSDAADVQKEYEEASAAFNARQFDAALKLTNSILEKDPNHTAARILSGKIFYYGENLAEAETRFTDAVARDDANLDARIWLARTIGLQAGKKERAIQLLQSVLAADSGNLEAWHALGQLHERHGETDRAIAAYRAAINQGKRLALIHLQLAVLYHKAQLPDQAVAQLTLAAALSDGDPELRSQVEAAQKAIAGE